MSGMRDVNEIRADLAAINVLHPNVTEHGIWRTQQADRRLAADVEPLLDRVAGLEAEVERLRVQSIEDSDAIEVYATARDSAVARETALREALKREHETHQMRNVAHVGGSDYICVLCQSPPRSQYDPVWPCEAVRRIDAALAAVPSSGAVTSGAEVQFVLIHDLGEFGPFPSRDAAFAYGSTLCTDPDVTYSYEAHPMTPPVPAEQPETTEPGRL